MEPAAPLIDNFGRQISYVRLSVTDRCDFRCVYCMAEEMTFLPKPQVLSLEEMLAVARNLVACGVSKIRLTGGEPLVRPGVVELARQIRALPGLKELCMTTNGGRLQDLAKPLRDAGVDRLNISLDSLDADRFQALTRTGRLGRVLAGIQAAQDAGFERTKLNAVILKGRNDDEILPLVRFALKHGLDLTFIEEMPLGQISEHDRGEAYMSSDEVRERIGEVYSLEGVSDETGGPSRYFRIPGESIRIGFISPHSHNFCGDCNRVRVTTEGRLLLCLGNEHAVDLRAALREGGQSQSDVDARVRQRLYEAMAIKPERHHFNLHDEPQILRFMNATGG
ncbi:GTP 3',8-cyclase MoaA [Marinobacter zhejiangensis]|uniref:GTP 3',8-cyclase n=1 Tax=Marinobacter zhejiangensis TaxID=488535 RepID=A0A1I4TC36_9GAMM|nr:GTP 3',8-cyclase MoaA [Marinobacter zhejiangensis]SFM74246.1 cyclic pyranopterin phosphate synthase [Marinobacter zhejiangensis]